MNDFTASNGVRVTVDRDGDFEFRLTGGGMTNLVSPGEPTEVAMREFFQAEDDERLSRWRDPQQPWFVIYGPFDADEIGRDLTVIDEATGCEYSYRRSEDDGHAHGNQAFEHPWSNKAAWAARHFFDAHPEPKPAWHEAEPWETWLITLDGIEQAVTIDEDREFRVRSEDGGWEHITSDAITAGRRLWPEVS